MPRRTIVVVGAPLESDSRLHASWQMTDIDSYSSAEPRAGSALHVGDGRVVNVNSEGHRAAPRPRRGDSWVGRPDGTGREGRSP